ncbi:TetR/AcrR family transcriptional regulator [Anabaena cylindrica FACHB-243]|uniref:Transcriptional regulator, TetR family n=1 Tax=Anabaena cylindrica (strain ATCC 27899 / PCC 7122) TaxID=272123 RepID=K9ZGJ4_ANACC|nr:MULTISPECIES: TetR/AcrR family transcriptional regulator [Anabaena]AFZ57490.1 transcriptional regulator, TetR family [Anabaena cylindrica PCC 7122]MBD2421173.1 TetR/AcrR family transcriptional regulator [Anabaena cylindrica FACHB-243]MBY5281729.1 TetR/AcrR family transcriptional regulator [Anabaena sp. CCAP 1446/1C]MBY5310316.1 TetR/AcrR family transcriptional regulator [Anabaena sp. CCAP 1446/1C]MCM2405931.1 TetR/AcrR family transcriptional regulator [Anabaena sp. CCAP 1446/1C]
MRHKDDKKNQAICDAAIELITANGFADTSMSKIAKTANVSPATIYVYFENKENLLNRIYLLVKQEMSAEMLKGVNQNLSVEKAFKMIWNNYYQYAIKNPVRFAFTEQFANSPMVDRICKDEGLSYFKPLIDLFNRGKEEKVFKDISLEIFTAFTFVPLTGLIKEHFSGALILDEKMLETIYKIGWDAITN